MSFIEFSESDRNIGLHTRQTPRGPEAELIDLFLDQFREQHADSKKKYALFYEPLLPTGFPDIVIAEYQEEKFSSWSVMRKNLTIFDLKILHHLYYTGGSSSENIVAQLAIAKVHLFEAIEHLLDANVITRKNRRWHPISIKHTYAITALHTIEAKVGNWDKVLKQAFLNKWFSSESYVMLPIVKPSEQNFMRAHSQGIGIFALSNDRKHIRKFVKADKNSLPTSYASWLFNEWIGRKLYNIEEKR